MSRLEITPFADEHLDDAARLLATRHARHRAAEPVLSARFEDSAAAARELETTWRTEGASGAAAFRGGRLVGYLIGAPRTEPAWGANTWVEVSGHAVEEAETVRDLYAVAASRWVEEGRPRHSVLVPAFDAELLELIDLDLALPDHQRKSPVFGGAKSSTREDCREEWLRTLAGSDEKVLIGAHEGRPVACWALVPAEQSSEHRGLLLPDHACHLGFAATLPEFRGSGISVALTDAALAWATDEGYPAMITDWRVTNLLASRFWPRRGFRLSFLRLYRAIP